MRLGKETLFTIDGRWDDTVTMRDKKTGKEEVLWKVGIQSISCKNILLICICCRSRPM